MRIVHRAERSLYQNKIVVDLCQIQILPSAARKANYSVRAKKITSSPSAPFIRTSLAMIGQLFNLARAVVLIADNLHQLESGIPHPVVNREKMNVPIRILQVVMVGCILLLKDVINQI